MLTKLTNTDAREITATLVAGESTGRSGSGQVLTLIVDTDVEHVDAVRENALEAGRLHPSRVLLIVRDPDGSHRQGSVADDETDSGIDAEILNGDDLPGEMVTLWLSGDAEQHASSVVRPLLLAELPIVIWWPNNPPENLDEHELSYLTRRKIVECGQADDQLAALEHFVAHHRHGQTDLGWARLTRWRALLVAMLDNVQSPVRAARISAPLDLAPAAIMQAWLRNQLKVDVEWEASEGPGLTGVTFETDAGEVSLHRDNDTEGIAKVPNNAPVTVALTRRRTRELLGEELTRLAGDAMFDAVIGELKKLQAGS